MEDAHTGELNVDGKGSAFFAVYDGLHPAPCHVPPSPSPQHLWGNAQGSNPPRTVYLPPRQARAKALLCGERAGVGGDARGVRVAGHAGTDVAIYSSKFLHKNVVDSTAYKVR